MMKEYIRCMLAGFLLMSGCAVSDETKSSDSASEAEHAETEKGDKFNDAEMIHIEQKGLYGKISLSLPEDWDYTLCPVDDAKLVNADYGIQFHPSHAKGCIELGYSSMFGVCGTGLQEEKATIAGQDALIGTYDTHERWDFISFTDCKIVALNCSTETWTDKEFEKAMHILHTISFTEEEKEGAIGFYQPDSEDISIGLEVSVTNVTSEGAIIHFNQFDDTKTNALLYGEDFTLEKKNGEDWISLPRNEDIAITAIAYGIPLMEISEHPYEWKYMYGSLESGEYRLGIHVMEENKGYMDHMVYAHFIIADDQ